MSQFIRSIRLKNFLSFGESSEHIELRPLNVLIGPNSSGKSNFLEAFALLAATPRDIAEPLRTGGGVGEWLWKGAAAENPAAEIEAVLDYPSGRKPLRYRLVFTTAGQRFELVDEVVENVERIHDWDEDVFFFYRYFSGHPMLSVVRVDDAETDSNEIRPRRRLESPPTPTQIDPQQSILSQRKGPDQYPEISYLANAFADFRFYREWNLGRNTPPRRPQGTDLPEDFLEEDARNLSLVLNDLQHRHGTASRIPDMMKALNGLFEDISIRIHGGTVQLYLREKGLKQPIPATRLSDGTLRFLCLLAILCHPEPPPLICLEEPEIGLHPDMMRTVAELLVDASTRTQLIVTTHSDLLVSALQDTPQSVMVCEMQPEGTQLRRLEPEKLETWLKKYTLGELWTMGELGGTRW